MGFLNVGKTGSYMPCSENVFGVKNVFSKQQCWWVRTFLQVCQAGSAGDWCPNWGAWASYWQFCSLLALGDWKCSLLPNFHFLFSFLFLLIFLFPGRELLCITFRQCNFSCLWLCLLWPILPSHVRHKQSSQLPVAHVLIFRHRQVLLQCYFIFMF